MRGEIGPLEARTAVEVSRRIFETATELKRASDPSNYSAVLAELRAQFSDAPIGS
jgi:hypothetical protein